MNKDQWKDLFLAGIDGDEESYSTLLSELTDAIRAYLSCRISDRGFVEDIAQEVLLSVHVARDTFDRERPFKPWLFAIVKRRMIDGFRKRGRTIGREVAGEDIFPTLGDSSAVETRIGLSKALDGLSEEKLQALNLISLEGKSTEEAAKEMNVKSSTFRVMYHRLVHSIKEEIE